MTAALLALLNAARGAGELPRWLFFPLCGLAALPLGWPTAVCVILGMAVFFAAGWHFDCITGQFTVHENKVRWITRACLWAVPPGTNPGREVRENKRRGTLWLALRGLHLYPLFAALAVLHGPAALLWGLGVALMGPVYYLAGVFRRDGAVRLGEYAYFWLAGILILLSTP